MGRLMRLCLSLCILGAILITPGCGPNCGDSCNSKDDCEGDLVCLGGDCVPRECGDCPGSIVFCYYSKINCDFIRCD